MKKGDIPGSRMIIFIGVALIGMIFTVAVLGTTLKPSLQSSDEARADYFAHIVASYIGALSSVDEGSIERDFQGKVDIEIERYTWFRWSKRPSTYYVRVTVYREGGQTFKKNDPGSVGKCELAYCKSGECTCKSCDGSVCVVVNLEKSETSDRTAFIGNVDMGSESSLKMEGLRYITFTKTSGSDGVKIVKVDSVEGCAEPSEEDVKQIIDYYSSKFEYTSGTNIKLLPIDTNVVKAAIMAENHFLHCDNGKVVVSPAGAYGMFQLLPSTATWMGDKYGESIDYKNHLDNLKAGILYLRDRKTDMSKYTQGYDLDKIAVANYNCHDQLLHVISLHCNSGGSSCWNNIAPYLDSSSGKKICKDKDGNAAACCQGTTGDETLNHVKKVFEDHKPCFDKNPDCYFSCSGSTCKKRGIEGAVT